MFSIKETVEAKSWALKLTYEQYVYFHNEKFSMPTMDQQAYKEFTAMMESWYERESL